MPSTTEIGATYVVRCFGFFELRSGAGTHVCSVMPYYPCSVEKVLDISYPQLLPLLLSKRYVRDLLIALVYLHETCGLTHCDLKPDNLLISFTQASNKNVYKAIYERIEQNKFTKALGKLNDPITRETVIQGKCVVCDFGCSIRHNIEPYPREIQALAYKAPEVLLGKELDSKVDMLSVGCIFYELLTGMPMFDPKAEGIRTVEQDHFKQFEEKLGRIPYDLIKGGKKALEIFSDDGAIRNVSFIRARPLKNILRHR